MNLETPEDKVRKLQEALQAKAKGSPSYPVLPAVRQGVSGGRTGIRIPAQP
jgi:hypothetical protein